MNRRLSPIAPFLPRLLLGFAAAACLGAAASAQEGAKPDAPRERAGGDASSSVVVTPYSPKVFGSMGLYETAAALFGSTIEYAEDGEQNVVAHFVVLGDLLLIRDTPPKTKKILAMFATLENEELKRRREADLASERGELGEDDATGSAEVRPRYVSFDTLVAALEPFTRPVRCAPDGGRGWTTNNVNPIPSGNLIVLNETPARLKSLLDLVDRIDQPRPQMSISVMLVKPGGGEARKLPKELVDNLRTLLPDQEFTLLSIGMLRCSAQSGQQCEMRMNLADGGNWSLRFFPEAYDSRSGELSLSHCTFHCELPVDGRNAATQDFDTSLTLKSGEYTVLGAVGADPTFVVLRAEPVRKAQ